MMRSLNLLLCSLLSLTVAAQEPAAKWENLKTLAPGTQFRVVSGASPKPIQGTFKSVTDSDLSLMRGASVESFPRTQIISVSARQRSHRLRNALIGLGVGTAAGALIGYGIGHAGCKNQTENWCGFDKGVDAGIGGTGGLVGGTLIGVFLQTGKWTEVYAR